jgi:hypothetical protein
MKNQNEQRKLKALVRELEHELSEGKSQLQELGETQERLQQAERICHELSDENRQLREKITDWQKRVAASEHYQKEISMLKQQLDALQLEHDALLQSNPRIEEQVNLQREPDISLSHSNDSIPLMTSQSAKNSGAVVRSEFSGRTNGSGDKVGDAGTSLAKAISISLLLPRLILQNWRFGAIVATASIAIAITGISIHVLKGDSPSPTPAPTETATALEPPAFASPQPSVAPAPRVRGTFQTVRPTQVFSEPSEDSALVANIAKGVRLNVVDSREGWLEIRSKHGRPPGFIRRDEAVKVSAN